MPEWLWIAAGAALALYLLFVLVLLVLGRRSDARGVASFVPDCLVSSSDCWATIGSRAREFIPVADQLDDAILILVVLRTVIGSAGPPLIHEHWPGPESSLAASLRLAGSSPVRWTPDINRESFFGTPVPP